MTKILPLAVLISTAVASYVPNDVFEQSGPNIDGSIVFVRQPRTRSQPQMPYVPQRPQTPQSSPSDPGMFSFFSILKYFSEKDRYQDYYGDYNEDCSDSESDYDSFDDESDGSGSEDDFEDFSFSDLARDFEFEFQNVGDKQDAQDATQDGANHKRGKKLKYMFDKERINKKPLVKKLKALTNSTMDPIRAFADDLGIPFMQADALAGAWYTFFELFSPVKEKLVEKMDKVVQRSNEFEASSKAGSKTSVRRQRANKTGNRTNTNTNTTKTNSTTKNTKTSTIISTKNRSYRPWKTNNTTFPSNNHTTTNTTHLSPHTTNTTQPPIFNTTTIEDSASFLVPGILALISLSCVFM